MYYKISTSSIVSKIILDGYDGVVDTPMGDSWRYEERIAFGYFFEENRFILWDYRSEKVRGIIIPTLIDSTEEHLFQLSTVIDTLGYELEFLKECQKVLLESKGQTIEGYIDL